MVDSLDVAYGSRGCGGQEEEGVMIEDMILTNALIVMEKVILLISIGFLLGSAL